MIYFKRGLSKKLLLILFLATASTGFSQDKFTDLKIKTKQKNEIYFALDTIRSLEGNETTFDSSVSFTDCNFLGPVYLEYCNFSHYVDFSGTCFSDLTIFMGSQFHDKLGYKAHFARSIFEGYTSFDHTRFYNLANFFNAKFPGPVTFTKSEFLNEVDFIGTLFSDHVDFSSGTFSRQALFDSAKFKGTLTLNRLQFTDSSVLSFSQTTFPDTIVFSNNTKIYREINFIESNFQDSTRYDYKKGRVKPILIYLNGSDISKLHLDYVHFKLLLPDKTLIEPFLTLTIDEKERLYESLLDNFKVHGQQESYKLCDIEYRLFRWNHSWASFLPCIPYYWNHFGYDKQLVFLWALIFIFLFTLINYFLITYLNNKVYQFENLPSSFKNFSDRSWFAFIYTSTIFFKLTLKIEKINFERKLGAAYLLVIYTLGLVCLAYMANFVLQK